jgi:hypothetical protein
MSVISANRYSIKSALVATERTTELQTIELSHNFSYEPAYPATHFQPFSATCLVSVINAFA